MNAAGLRRQDTTKGPPLRILSLDGGGVRGYSMFIMLQELMHRIYVEINGEAPRGNQIPKPCDHFDLIAGTGTGGLIAIMLGRLRLDLETCMNVYVRMTKKVFETDKTIAGIPYRSTLFKASKLEEAIRECVKEHTVFEDEGNDSISAAQDISSPMDALLSPSVASIAESRGEPHRTPSTSSRGPPPRQASRGFQGGGRWGNEDTLLYDIRETRTKTAVTAVYKGTPLSGGSVLLRSYDSRKEPAPETNCTIWQAGRATCATMLAFKPIQVGQSIFLDEGAGKYNPSPQILDEAAVNEWPGREVGVFVSIGTGKRPGGSDHLKHQWWEGFASGAGEFAEARRRLIAKIEGCEEIHQYMLRDHLRRRQVLAENYFRLNVEVGVGEFGMNEWGRLSDISTNTRMYLSKPEVQAAIMSAGSKMGRIYRAKVRWQRDMAAGGAPPQDPRHSWQATPVQPEPMLPSNPYAIELPGDAEYHDSRPGAYRSPAHSYQQSVTSDDKFAILPPEQTSPRPIDGRHLSAPIINVPVSPRISMDQSSYHDAGYDDAMRPSFELPTRNSPPPIPPKTPIADDGYQKHFQYPEYEQHPTQRMQGYEGYNAGQQGVLPRTHGTLSRPPAGISLPYPGEDAPPPPVNMARKPEYGYR